jgi:hypothetical protein
MDQITSGRIISSNASLMWVASATSVGWTSMWATKP